MALHDLKKKPRASKPKQFCDVDSFIAQAELYARGCENVVHLPIQARRNASKQPAKNATFSLNQAVIAELDQIKQKTGLSKSYLVRALTHHLAGLEDPKQQAILKPK